MIARALAAIALVASVGYATPWTKPAMTDIPPTPGWSLKQAVEKAFAEVLPDDRMAFALESAQSSRVEGGGHRFEGSGIGTWGEGDTRFIVFTMTLSSQGELVEFDYGSQAGGFEETDAVAGN